MIRRIASLLLLPLLAFAQGPAGSQTTDSEHRSAGGTTITTNIVTGSVTTSLVYSASGPDAPPWDFIVPALGQATNEWCSNSVYRVSPTGLVLYVQCTKAQGLGNMPKQFNFSDANGDGVALPALSKIVCTNNGVARLPVAIDFKRACRYSHNEIFAPYVIGAWLTLYFTNSFADGDVIRVVNADNTVFTNIGYAFTRTLAATDFNPAIQVNQVGYAPTQIKTFDVSWYCGSNLMEHSYTTNMTFNVYDVDGSSNILTGTTVPRIEAGWGGSFPSYQKVYEGDWSSVTKEGLYEIRIPNMGKSLQTRISSGYPLLAASMGAKGLYAQICGAKLDIPYSSLVHDVCHTSLTECITNTSQATLVANLRSDANFTQGDWNVQKICTNAPACLTNYWSWKKTQPFLGNGGGYHDAGDYSIYTQNASILGNKLMMAVDIYTGVRFLDNLGIPQSGDGIPDLLQMAKYQADQLLDFQDTDGGVAERNVGYTNYYENGDPGGFQRRALYPKDILPTCSAVGLWADMACDPLFKKFYPDAATNYLRAATNGFVWVTNVITASGSITNAYRPPHFYGQIFGPVDELAYAGSSLFLATSNTAFMNFTTNFQSTLYGSGTRKYGYVYEWEAFGEAQRTVAFSEMSGKVPKGWWAASGYGSWFSGATQELIEVAGTVYTQCTNNAYRIPYFDQSKFDADTPFLHFPKMIAPLIHGVEIQRYYGQVVNTNWINTVYRTFDWEFGQNPANKGRWAMVGLNPIHSSASQQDRFDVYLGPPTGFAKGSVISDIHGASFGQEHEQVGWPHEYNAGQNIYSPLYERLFQDVFDTLDGEMTVGEIGDQVASSAWLAGNNCFYVLTPTINVPNAASNGVAQVITALVPGVDTSLANFQWEMYSNAISYARQPTWTPKGTGVQRLKVEIKMPNGMTYCATNNVTVN